MRQETRMLRPRNTFRALAMEHLEGRTLMAGDVSVDFRQGNLRLSGDPEANYVVILQLGLNRHAVIGLNGTTVEGQVEPFVVNGLSGDIDVDTGMGDDVFSVGNDIDRFRVFIGNYGIVPELGGDLDALGSFLQGILDSESAPSQFTVPRNLRLRGGAGVNRMIVVADVAREVDVDFRAGSINSFWLDYSHVGGNVEVRGGNRDDEVALEHSDIAGSFEAHLGNGENGVGFLRSTVGGYVKFHGGRDTDAFIVGESRIDESVVIRTGAGEDFIYSFFADIRGHYDIDTGSHADYVELGGSTPANTVVRTGSHNDRLVVSSLEQGGHFSVDLGSGNDLAMIQNLNVRRSATISAGSGNDQLSLHLVHVDAALTLLLGAGNDVLDISHLSTPRALILGGSGTDAIVTENVFADTKIIREFEPNTPRRGATRRTRA